MIRRFDEPIRPGVRYSERPGAYAIIARAGEVLLTFQAKPEPEFQLPGGGIDAGETPVVALHREVAEETGWGIHSLRRLGAFRRFTYMPEYNFWARKTCHIYLCRPTRRKSEVLEAFHSAHWLAMDEAVGMLANGGDRFFLGQILAGRRN
jgi:8-oxo-dGTP diphosphatase